MVACLGLAPAKSVQAMGRLASGPRPADVALAFIQVACFIKQGYTSRLPEYINKATILLVSESGASRNEAKR
jgi:hypothetical protein